MKKNSILNTIIFTGINLFIGLNSNADVIRCQFTEPFLTTVYSMSQQTLTVTGPEKSNNKVIRNVSFQIKEAGKFELVSKSKVVLQSLVLDKQGSDGMSDAIFPFSVTWGGEGSSGAAIYGGCSSNFLKATESNK